MTDIDLSSYFTQDQIKPDCLIWRWNLNNIPSDPAQRILVMAELIKHCTASNYRIALKPDRRIRAKGLSVLFANSQS